MSLKEPQNSGPEPVVNQRKPANLKLWVEAVCLIVFLCLGFIVLVLFLFQANQAIQDRRNSGTIEGIAFDQDGRPLPGVVIIFKAWNWRMYVPIPFTATRTIERQVKATTGPDGSFATKAPLPRTDFVGASKTGYRLDGRETDYMWEPWEHGPTKPWKFHLFNEALMRRDQIRSFDHDSIAFPKDGQLCFNLVTGETSDPANADLVFRWQRLPATADHGAYGKYIISAPKGGVWLWEQERLFAPATNYESGMVFFFGPEALGAYMKRHRAEMFVTSRNGQVYARVYSQLDTGGSALSIRGRVNSSHNRFVDSKSESYAIGVYGSLSPNYMNPGVPWWYEIRLERNQVILSPDHASIVFSGNAKDLRWPEYFAGYYKTPAAILEMMATGPLAQDFHVPQALAKNLAAPAAVLQELKKNAGLRARGVEATLAVPEDLKEFLTNFD